MTKFILLAFINFLSISLQKNVLLSESSLSAFYNRNAYPVRKSIKGLQPDFQDMNQVVGNEVHTVAFNLVWSFWQPSLQTQCSSNQFKYDGFCYNIDYNTVKSIKAYTERGVLVTGVVYGTPKFAQRDCKRGSNVQAEIFCAPVNGKEVDYGRFCGFLAHYFNGENGNGRVVDFVIHNEVNSYVWFNIGCFDLSCPLNAWTEVYAKNYNKAYDYIKKEQKLAKVLISLDHYFGKSVGISRSAKEFLNTLIPKLGNRQWKLAFHSYPPNLGNPYFTADDYANNGIISFGNIGILAGWLRSTFPNKEESYEIMLTENGINGANPQMNALQQTYLCQAFRNVLGTPGVTSFIYHRLVDMKEEGLNLGLWNSDRSQKPAWSKYALCNRKGHLSCGFEVLPYTKLQRGYGKKKHWVTTRMFPSHVKVERSWRILREKKPDTVLIFECRVGGVLGSHTMMSDDVHCEGQFNMGPMGWLYIKYEAGRIPIYRCYIPGNGDHFISDNENCEGYKTERKYGYAL